MKPSVGRTHNPFSPSSCLPPFPTGCRPPPEDGQGVLGGAWGGSGADRRGHEGGEAIVVRECRVRQTCIQSNEREDKVMSELYTYPMTDDCTCLARDGGSSHCSSHCLQLLLSPACSDPSHHHCTLPLFSLLLIPLHRSAIAPFHWSGSRSCTRRSTPWFRSCTGGASPPSSSPTPSSRTGSNRCLVKGADRGPVDGGLLLDGGHLSDGGLSMGASPWGLVHKPTKWHVNCHTCMCNVWPGVHT